MIGRMFQRRGNQLVEVTNPSVILADTSNLVQSNIIPVYVNADTGDDANYGDTTATAVRTINRALELAVNRPSVNVDDCANIYISEGTYTEQVIVYDSLTFIAQGNVVIAGNFGIHSGGSVNLIGQGQFTINGALEAVNNARLFIDADITVNGQVLCWNSSLLHSSVNASIAINYVKVYSSNLTFLYCGEGSVMRFGGEITLSGVGDSSGNSSAVAAFTGVIIFTGGGNPVTISATNVRELVTAYSGGVIQFYSAISALTFNGSCSQSVVVSRISSHIHIDQTIPVSGNVTGVRYKALINGSITVNGAGINRIPGTQPGTVEAATFGYYG